ncbi:hypothetical protein B0G76_4471 [Paraburkholderia sp. BL23I1N1]|nr:hypothetical protein [Paraburkholderia sp. BL23I1N1]RKE38174.1 hypothetical protein B0G76_4471 [Paraburkholderia sp. BL23I1N1]
MRAGRQDPILMIDAMAVWLNEATPSHREIEINPPWLCIDWMLPR